MNLHGVCNLNVVLVCRNRLASSSGTSVVQLLSKVFCKLPCGGGGRKA